MVAGPERSGALLGMRYPWVSSILINPYGVQVSCLPAVGLSSCEPLCMNPYVYSDRLPARMVSMAKRRAEIRRLPKLSEPQARLLRHEVWAKVVTRIGRPAVSWTGFAFCTY